MERLKNMGLKKSFFFLSVWCILISLLLVLLVFLVSNAIKSGYPSGGIEISSDGVAILLKQPTEAQQRVITLLTYFQWLSCIVLPVSGLGIAAVLFYRIKLKKPIDLLRDGTEHIRANNLNFS
ncbi:MAG: sensor histidine kinase, partial [Lachnospiraceae bacterium]|nr:sensor histidine kinase [Lachnospiraceae bacterium]